jgi:predicted nucleic acid-binding protein
MFILADSGILLRLFEPRDPQNLIVSEAVRFHDDIGDEFVTAIQNTAEFWNVCTRPVTARGGMGLSFAVTERRLEKIEQKFAIVAETELTYPLWRNLVIKHSVQGKEVHDGRLVALIKSHGITHIMTLNGGDFKRYPGITVIDPMNMPAATPPPSP